MSARSPAGGCATAGSHGCVEAYAGRGALEEKARELAKDRPTILFELMEKRGRDRLTSGVWLRALQAGDEVAEELIPRAVQALGVGIGSAVTLLDVEAVVIGGGLGERLGADWLARIEAAGERAHVLPRAARVPARRARRSRRRDRREPARVRVAIVTGAGRGSVRHRRHASGRRRRRTLRLRYAGRKRAAQEAEQVVARRPRAMSASLQPRAAQCREERGIVLRSLEALDAGTRLQACRHQPVGRLGHRRQHLAEPGREVAAEAHAVDPDHADRVLEVVDDAVERSLLVADRERVQHQPEEPAGGGEGAELVVGQVARVVVDGTARGVRADRPERRATRAMISANARRRRVGEIEDHPEPDELVDERATEA